MAKALYERAALIVQSAHEIAKNDIERGLAKAIEEGMILLFGDDARFDAARFRRACAPGANVKARPSRRKHASGEV